MEYQRFGHQYVLRLDPGEDVRATLLDFIRREDIRGGYFIAFGAFSRLKLQYFKTSLKRYEDHEINQQVEVVSLLGNIARENGQPVIHMHAAVADEQLRTYSGHVSDGTVRPTLEVFLTSFEGEIRRERDAATGLELIAFSRKPPSSLGQR